jgi:hypothetical protein
VFTPSASSGMEEALKRRAFPYTICAGEVISTIEEAEKIKASLPPDMLLRGIVVVTDQWHSKSARLVWKHIWKDDPRKPDIRFVVIPSSETIDPKNPMWALRKHWRWASVNVSRHAFLVCVPGSIWIMDTLNIHQPTD